MTKLIVTLLLFLFSNLAFSKTTFTYCVPVKEIDFNPYREIRDGKDLAYLTLLRSYISTETTEPGLLAGFEFSPNGKILTGRIAKNLAWSDGSQVTARELVDGIAKTLQFRALGKRVKIEKIDLLNESTFRILFSSEIQNLTGVLREALSTNSRHNRFWPAKFANKAPLVIGKFPQTGATTFRVFGHIVSVVNTAACKAANFSIFPEALATTAGYRAKKSSASSAILLQTNTVSLNLNERIDLANAVRTSFASASNDSGLIPTNAFFLVGEPGFEPNSSWPKAADKKSTKRKFKLGYELPLFAKILAGNPLIQLIKLPTQDHLDGQLLASGVQDGRLVVLQDLLRWENVDAMLKNALTTRATLIKIAESSASTIPPDNKILAEFGRSALSEMAVIPVARRNPVALSSDNSPIDLNFNSKGEVTFSELSNK